MANQNNLKPIRSKKEAREKGKNGGIKSGESRRKRKSLKEELLLLLETKEYNKKISLALIHEAELGNVKAFNAIRDTIGENPKEDRENDENNPFEVNVRVINKI